MTPIEGILKDIFTGWYSIHQEDDQEAERADGSGAEGHVAIKHTQGYIL